MVVPVEDDLALGVAHPVEDIEGCEAQREHQPGNPVNSRGGVDDNSPALRLCGPPGPVLLVSKEAQQDLSQ